VGAVGTNVYSTISNQNYAVFSGTSMSCPGTSGTIAQLYQAYNVVHGQDPEGALIKAILMNTADDKGNVGPDFRYGFGRINARRALNVITGSAHFSAAADQGDTTTYPLIVPGGLKQLKLMLYWHDLEATPGAQIALVNDLDLRLVSPAGDTILPWVLDTTATPAALNTPATRGHDHVNNVEQVVVDTPAAGNWQVVVIGHQVPFGPQPAVFTYDFMDEGITVVYPNGDEGFVPLENEMVRWDAPDDTTGFDLSYSADNGTTWTPVASVGSSVRLYSWYIPDTLSGQCLFRVERGGVSDISNAPFSIIGVPTGLAVTWSCEDSSRLSWNPVAGATGYEVFRLGSRYMEPVDTVADTTVVLQGIGLFDEEWFSVRAHGPLGANGRRAVAVQKPVGFAACPLKFDAMTEEVIVPGSGTIQNCHNLTALQVKMVLRNNGVDTLSAIPVNYRLNGGPVRSDVYAPDLLPGASVAYEFTFTENLSAAGTYITEVWVDYPGDDNSYNDTVITEMRVIAGSTVSAPVTEDFEGMNNCATFGCTFTCALGNGWTNVQNSTTDDIDFRVFSGTTPSDLTGPGGSDFMPGIPSGTYAYIESTSCSNRQAVMLSPCIDLTGVSQPLLTFGGHFYGGPDMGELHVDVFEGGAWYPDVLSPQSGNAGNFWLTRQADLSAFAGKVITVRFRADSGDDERGDMAIDGIRIGALMSVEEQVQEIRLYPNPADEVLYIAGPEGVRWQVLDLQGRAVAEGMGTIAQLAHVSAGVYVIVLEIDGVRRTSRFVKN
jgi:subtilisin family serine protease